MFQPRPAGNPRKADRGTAGPMLQEHRNLAGFARYLEGDKTPEHVLAFLQQTLNKSFSGVFREPGDFSVRQFVRAKRARALFIEYDIAMGSRLSPIYRILMDMAIKEALGLGRPGRPGATSSSCSTSSRYCPTCRTSVRESTSAASRAQVPRRNAERQPGPACVPDRDRRKHPVRFRHGPRVSPHGWRQPPARPRPVRRQPQADHDQRRVRAQGVQQIVVAGNVIEDWVLSSLTCGQCVVSLPEGRPFFFAVQRYQPPGR